MHLTFVLHKLLGGHPQVCHLGVASTLHIQQDELGWPRHQLDGVAVASVVGRVYGDALSGSLKLREKLL